jgi:hypothetical protein
MGAKFVIASAAKQSIEPRRETMDCFVASAPRNDVEGFRFNFTLSEVVARLDRAIQYSKDSRG